MDEQSDQTRVCPSCGEERPARAFRSAHPRTHCDVCHEARAAGSASPTPAEEEQPAEQEPDPSELARCSRLERARVPADVCPVLGLRLDAGPDSPTHASATRVRGIWMSASAASIVRAGLTPEQLELAAAWLREQAGAV